MYKSPLEALVKKLQEDPGEVVIGLDHGGEVPGRSLMKKSCRTLWKTYLQGTTWGGTW